MVWGWTVGGGWGDKGWQRGINWNNCRRIKTNKKRLTGKKDTIRKRKKKVAREKQI